MYHQKQIRNDKLTLGEIELFTGDLPHPVFESLQTSRVLAWDIETSGLNWHQDKIATCQLFSPGKSLILVRIDGTRPSRLCSLLQNPSITKVFHHAMFDLRFMCHRWNTSFENVVCTKIAGKLLDPAKEHEHSLQSLLNRYLGVTIDKTERMSNWFSENLTMEQLHYAAADVIYLPDLVNVLEKELERKQLLPLAQACFVSLPAMVWLDVMGYTDIFGY